LAISDWTRIEFSSAVARHIRVGHISQNVAVQIETAFEALVATSFVVVSPAPPDFDTARDYLRRYEMGLRAGDALHLAIASNNGAETIYSLDRGVLKAGGRLRLPVSAIGLR
jgi:predicted nucleic acid-binding protein